MRMGAAERIALAGAVVMMLIGPAILAVLMFGSLACG